MRRTSIAFALSTLLLASICSAQQTASTSQHTAPKAGNPANTTTLVGGPDTVVNCVQAQVGRIAMFTAATLSSVILCNSGIYEALPYGTGAIGILNPHPIAALDVNGDINSTTTYQIGGSSVLSIGSPADYNLFLGLGAGVNNVSGQGNHNVFTGTGAGYSNTTGYYNTFVGVNAGANNTTGYNNVFTGTWAGYRNITGGANTFTGNAAGYSNTTGAYNTFIGSTAGANNTTGNYNTSVGLEAGANANGSINIFIGVGAGNYNTTGNNNIYMGNLGGNSASESSTIRIGGDNGSGYGPQTATYIAGIYGSTSSGGHSCLHQFQRPARNFALLAALQGAGARHG
jgi:hypothetical protein